MHKLLNASTIILFLGIIIIKPAIAQISPPKDSAGIAHIADSLFRDKGEMYFKFSIADKKELGALTKIISIHKLRNKDVYAYANKDGFIRFLKLNYTFSVLQNPGSGMKPERQGCRLKKKNSWDFYPSYPAYEKMMYQFAKDYPSLCRIDTIGMLESGKKILAIRITGNKSYPAKPRFLYTSTMHGNETTGYALMLRLIDSLLTSYGNSSRITSLIDRVDIYINPLANPDGTYRYSDSTVYSSTRYNKNNIDINRNFPDPADGQHPDGYQWQPETVAFMNYAKQHNFTMSANLHTGSEVVNYPWDTWYRLSADDNWWQCVSRQFADTVHKYSYKGYLTEENNGITNGYQWYRITGGRQDFMNYFMHCRECTIELSINEITPAQDLPDYWNYTKRAFIDYIEKSTQGFHGFVTDSANDKGIAAKVFISGHDKDSSHVYSFSPSGDYHRLIHGGKYNITFSAKGYYSKTVNDAVLNDGCDSTLYLNVKLTPVDDNAKSAYKRALQNALLIPNPSDGNYVIDLKDKSIAVNEIRIHNIIGKMIYSFKPNPVNERISICIPGIQRGIYFTSIITADGNHTLMTLIE